MATSSIAPTSVVDCFCPTVRDWFVERFGAPTDAQAAGWPSILSGRDTLLAAPTGSGKTLAAFMAGIDRLVREAEAGDLEAATSIVYVSPLKALSNDIQRNLEEPLEGIRRRAVAEGREPPAIRTGLRTGDTTANERQQMVRRPPHILITTPESLYLMVTAQRSRETLRGVTTVIVDEIHALARDRRGSHLALTLARLDHVADARPQRVGLSATQRPIDEIARFLTGVDSGAATRPCDVVDLGHQRDLDLGIEVPPTDLEAVAQREQWGEIYDRLAELVAGHRTTLVFVNTRTQSERVAHNLAERLGDQAVASHHGSLSKERRQRVEQRLKAGDLRALVATASLELGIDIGSIDLVCQIGSPRSMATFLQRIGRSGHALGLRPHGRLFPTTRDELIEAAALIRAGARGPAGPHSYPRGAARRPGAADRGRVRLRGLVGRRPVRPDAHRPAQCAARAERFRRDCGHARRRHRRRRRPLRAARPLGPDTRGRAGSAGRAPGRRHEWRDDSRDG